MSRIMRFLYPLPKSHKNSHMYLKKYKLKILSKRFIEKKRLKILLFWTLFLQSDCKDCMESGWSNKLLYTQYLVESEIHIWNVQFFGGMTNMFYSKSKLQKRLCGQTKCVHGHLYTWWLFKASSDIERASTCVIKLRIFFALRPYFIDFIHIIFRMITEYIRMCDRRIVQFNKQSSSTIVCGMVLGQQRSLESLQAYVVKWKWCDGSKHEGPRFPRKRFLYLFN